MEVLSKFIQFGCNFVLSVVPLSVEIFLREWGLREGRWKRDKRGLGTRGTPRMVEYWWTWPINRLWLVTDGRRRDKDGARGVRRGVGLWWGWVQGGSWEHWRNRCKRWSCLEVSGGVLSSASVGPLPVSASPSVRVVGPCLVT